jgi:hypothetical protein
MLKRRLTEATSSAVRYFDLIRVTAQHGHEGASNRSFQINGMEVAKPPRSACDRGSAPGGGGDFRFVPAVADMAEIAGVARCSRHPGDRAGVLFNVPPTAVRAKYSASRCARAHGSRLSLAIACAIADRSPT